MALCSSAGEAGHHRPVASVAGRGPRLRILALVAGAAAAAPASAPARPEPGRGVGSGRSVLLRRSETRPLGFDDWNGVVAILTGFFLLW